MPRYNSPAWCHRVCTNSTLWFPLSQQAIRRCRALLADSRARQVCSCRSVQTSPKPVSAMIGLAIAPLVYALGFLRLPPRALHDVVPTLRGGVVLAADCVAVDVGG